MKNLIFALLTTLFVSAMPLQAAYALADDAAPTQACEKTSLAAFASDEAKAEIKARGGFYVILTEADKVKAFAEHYTQKSGNHVPEETDAIVVSVPEANFPKAVLTAFKQGCFLAYTTVPTADVPFLVGTEKPDPKGQL